MNVRHFLGDGCEAGDPTQFRNKNHKQQEDDRCCAVAEAPGKVGKEDRQAIDDKARKLQSVMSAEYDANWNIDSDARDEQNGCSQQAFQLWKCSHCQLTGRTRRLSSQK